MRGWVDRFDRVLVLGLLLALSTPSSVFAQSVQTPVGFGENTGSDWVELSSIAAGSGLATETIAIAPGAGPFDHIRVSSSGAEVFIQELRVYFADGDMQRVASNIFLPANDRSSAFDLEGGARRLDRVEMTFKLRSGFAAHRTVVGIWAEPAVASDRRDTTSAGFDADWLLLGKETVGAAVSRHVIPIGEYEGRFDALRLRVLRSDVAFHDIRVVYDDGASDTLAVRKLLRAGDASPPLGLAGAARFIREIELVHEANPDMRGLAVVQVWAHRPER